MEVFPDSGFRPWRAIPRTMCFTFASGCSADFLMSLSFIPRTRDQSVLYVLEEGSRLTFCCLSKRNDVDAVLCLGMNDGHGDALQQSERDETLLVVAEAVILIGERSTIEYARDIHKVQSVVLQVPLTLNLVPRKPHRSSSVYSTRIYVKRLEHRL